MSEHKFPRQARPDPETFQINDPAVGKTFTIRECTDEQLQRYAAEAVQQQAQLIRQAVTLMGQASQAAACASVMNYELDRRKRTITIATDLSQIQGLPRQ